jgi:hypothetical protein
MRMGRLASCASYTERSMPCRSALVFIARARARGIGGGGPKDSKGAVVIASFGGVGDVAHGRVRAAFARGFLSGRGARRSFGQG